jgi:hypothetical protein
MSYSPILLDLQVMDNMRRVCDLNKLQCNVIPLLLLLLCMYKIARSCSSSDQIGWKFALVEKKYNGLSFT